MTTTTTTAAYVSDDLEQRATSTPDETCWVMGDRSWTWGRAWQDARRLAGALAAAGVRRGDRIGFLEHNHAALLITLHAVSLIGAADVVIDPRLSREDLEHVLTDADVRLVLVGHEHADAVRGLAIGLPRCVVVGGPDDELDAMIASAAPLDRHPDVTPDDPCLVLYSSGTTGRLKGIVLTQHNLVVHTRNAFGQVDCGPGDRVLLSNLMFHSCALHAAATGATSVLAPDLMPDSLLEAMEAGLTHAFLTPAAIGRLDAAGLLGSFDRLALVAYGAAPMPVPRLRRAMAAWPRTRFVQLYGLTECVAVLTALTDADHRDEAHPERIRSCGRATPGVEVRVVEGELWFRTDQLMAGYLGSPEATAEVVADGWMRSGDLGRIDDDGYVYVEDRLKDLILVNGWSVFSAEVERVLADHPAVQECAVIGVPDEACGEAVKALVRFRDGDRPGSDAVIEHCRQQLADHKVPSSVEPVEDFPRNALGKIVKRDLRASYWAAAGRRI